ncbi:MAG: Rieske 2Fe-2S domain-containing protein [Roseiflexaceae bacterium]
MMTESLIANEIALGPIGQIPPGEGRNFEVQGQRIAVFHTRIGEVFATQAECPHRVGPLADGLLGGTTLVCPLHAWKFDLATGAALFGDCGITTYPARLNEDGDLALTLDEQQTPA